ncbi:SDR family oxidoreductase [Undibacterium sp. Ji83W]|uniref:SDR family oxidoreductase n=1 Tax=Undibacterium sp. Ji83W TaxID=3413043 RepID=UPI003BF42B7E
MRVFVTGATGFVGTAVVQELIQAGHQVLGLARSDAAAAALLAAGAEVQRGDLEDLASLRRGVANADGVIHTGFIHDFARFQAVCETDERAIEAIGAELAGSNRPFIVTSGAALVAPGRMATEADLHQAKSATYPRASEHAAMVLAANGVNASVVRLPPSVHGAGDHGFVPILINLAREKGVSAYVDEGLNRWTAVHRQDAAKVYRLALERASAGARYHAIAEEGIAFKEIAEVIGRHLHIPVVAKSGEDAAKHFGWFAGFAKIDCPASSQLTREALGWQPEQTGLIADIETADYFKTE